MCGAAFPQVNLDRIRLPFSIGTYDHKIQRETPDDSFFRKTPANLAASRDGKWAMPLLQPITNYL